MGQLRKFRFISALVIGVYLSSLITPLPADAFDGDNWHFNGYITGGSMPVSGSTGGELQQIPAKHSAQSQDPINIHTGESSYSFKILSIPGRGMDLDIRHEYQSSLHNNGRFGYGWTLNYYERLHTLENGNVMLTRAGRKDEYTNAGSGNYNPPAGFFETLVQNGNGTWTLTKAQGLKHNYDINGNLSSIVDRNANTISFTYEAEVAPYIGVSPYGQDTEERLAIGVDFALLEITDTMGRTVEFNYDGDGRLTSIVDENERTVSFDYDEDTDDLLTITKPATTQFPSGTTKTFTYDNGHNILTIEDAKEQVFVTNHYEEERVIQQDLGSGTMYLDFDVANQTTVTDRNGFETTYTFNAAGNPTSIEVFTDGLRAGEPGSYITAYAYNGLMLLTSVTYPKDNGVKYVYQEASDPRAGGNLTQIRRKADMGVADNNNNDIVTSITYESQFNQVSSVTDPNGNVWLFDYDEDGNLTEFTYPMTTAGTAVMTFDYNAYGQMTEMTDANGHVTQYTYNATTGYLESVTRDPGGIEAVTAFTYDAFGNLDTVTDANEHVTDLDYDALGWLNQVENPLGFLTKYTYDANGNVETIERQADTDEPVSVWQTTEFTYTNMNKVATIEDPLDRVTTYAYDDDDNLQAVEDAENNVTGYVWDERGLLFTVTDATTTGTTVYDYDINGNIAKITDAEGNESAYDFDLFDRLETTTYEDTLFDEYAYDKNSNITEHIKPSEDSIEFVYDEINRLIEKNFPDTPSLDTAYQYDVGSRLIAADNNASDNSFTYDALDRVLANTQTFNSQVNTVTYDYDPVGNRLELVYESGRNVDQTYDDNDRLDTITVNGSSFIDYDYDPLDRRITKDYTGSALPVATYSYDIANQLQSVTNELGNGSDISIYEYPDYDGAGNREKMVRTLQTTTNGTINYAYNDIYELTTVTGSQSHSYAYDSVGNRTTADGITYTPNELNQYDDVDSVNFYYDSNGNLTDNGINDYTYDEENRLTTFSDGNDSASYTYDAFNRRVSKTVNSVTTYYLYDGDDLIAEYASNGSLIAEYVHGAEVDETLAMYRSGNVYYYHHDGLGSVTEITNAAGSIVENYTYDSYGYPSVTSSSINNPYMFTGRQWDEESGIYYYRARMYDPAIGRFLQRDPVGYYDHMNLYAYTGNDPINWIDPFGLCEEPWGSGYGQDALDYWAQSDHPLWFVPGFFSALWTPDTYWMTATVLGVAGGAAIWGRMPAYWQYYPKGSQNYVSKWATKGTQFKAPYKVGKVAANKLSLPNYNSGTAVRKINVDPKQLKGPFKVKPDFGKEGGGIEYLLP